MIIFKDIEIKNYRNVKAELTNLKDLNILIGPNNCGKTNILEFIFSLSKLGRGGGYDYLCTDCNRIVKEVRESGGEIPGISISLSLDDFYLKKDYKKEKITLAILFDEGQIDKLVPGVLKKQKEMLNKTTTACQHIKNDIIMESSNSGLYGKHLSPLIHEDIIDDIRKSILYCPEGRLQSYKDKNLDEFIRERKFSGADFRKLIKSIGDLVDPKIHDHKYEDLIRKIEDEDIVVSIKEQGSGIRSLICLVADILSEKDAKVILIDEPELGLNPFAKQAFLNFLVDEAKEKQIFIATQDPTFLNPNLWEEGTAAVYFYSLIDEKFVKIDLDQNQADYSTFCGFLPHTTSLKEVHLYLEGTSDVYVFQIWLEKYLKQKYPIDEGTNKENAWKRRSILNRVGIYHLGGSNWKHLLYTIPKPPYKCVIVLDGDKREEAKNICEKYNKSEINASKFKFCQNINEVAGVYFKNQEHPVYCLKEDCIEKYLFPDFDCKNLPKNFNKKVKDSQKAEEMDEIPPEIEELFKNTIGEPGIQRLFVSESLSLRQ